MEYGKLNVIGDQVFFDRVAVADIRSDALPSIKDNFKAKILKADRVIKESEESPTSDYEDGHECGVEDGYQDGYENGKSDGYDEGYSDALANKPLDKKE